MSQTKPGELKQSIKDEVDALSNEKIQERINLLSDQYVNISERIQDMLSSANITQQHIEYCLSVLQSRGIKIDIPEVPSDGS